jgi:2-polyprenyl-6-methoxyphenol hydroxylase-like FAD-dependent oxidoreductase
MNDLIAAFERLGTAGPSRRSGTLIDTACVLGGSVAGLLAARVLADHAKQVVVLERDTPAGEARPREGVPQGRHVHTILPGGLRWMERWLPGLTQQVQAGGGVLADPAQIVSYIDGHAQAPSEYRMLMASRPFLELAIRQQVAALPNVSLIRSRATGLEYRGNEVIGVRHVTGTGPRVLRADITVDAMGRASRLSDWLSGDGYERPGLQRLPTAINYATAVFERDRGPGELELASSIARFGPPYPADGVAVAAVNAIEGSRWQMLLVGYEPARPGRTIDAFRAACAKLPPPFPQAANGAPAGEIAFYHQAESRRRDFARARRFPARLVSAGDAVASFNPIYGQGMSSAALHAGCLSEFLGSGPDLRLPARAFFELQEIVVDAAWAVSAGSDAARLDAVNGRTLPEEVRRQRERMDQIMHATLVDEKVCRAFRNVTFMMAHPATLADPALYDRAVAANSAAVHGRAG